MKYLTDETGASSTEYALVCALVAIALVGCSIALSATIKTLCGVLDKEVCPVGSCQ